MHQALTDVLDALDFEYRPACDYDCGRTAGWAVDWHGCAFKCLCTGCWRGVHESTHEHFASGRGVLCSECGCECDLYEQWITRTGRI